MKGWFVIVVLLAGLVFAQDVPVGLQKIIEHNEEQALKALTNISFFIAFIAGTLTVLSPCIFPLLPAYFSVTFKEKRNITRMTLVFFAGFTTVFVGFGLVAGLIGENSLSYFQKPALAIVAGIVLIIMGSLAFFNKGFSSFIRVKRKTGQDIVGVYTAGLAFAFGWSACVGPILLGILSIAALFGSIGLAMTLMIFYSLGIFVPLVLFSMVYDKVDLSKKAFFKGRTYSVKLFGKKLKLHSSSMVAGSLLILLGLVFIVFQSTAFVNGWDVLGTSKYFYSIQGFLLENPWTTWVGLVVFVGFVGLLVWFFQRGGEK